MKNIFYIPLFISFLTAAATAQEIKITVQSPERAEPGEMFRAAYRVLGEPEGEPRLTLVKPDGIEVVMGPAKSSEVFMQVVAGVETREESVTYTYGLMAEKARVYNLPKLTVKVAGREYTSEPASIMVRAGSGSPDGAPAQPREEPKPNLFDEFFGSREPATAPVTSHDRGSEKGEPVISVEVSESGEGYTVYYIVYLQGELESAGPLSEPFFAGGTVKDISGDSIKIFPPYDLDGVKYNRYLLKKYMMVPKSKGEHNIADETYFLIKVKEDVDGSPGSESTYYVKAPETVVYVPDPEFATETAKPSAADRSHGEDSTGEMSRFFTKIVPYALLPILLLLTVAYLRKLGGN